MDSARKAHHETLQRFVQRDVKNAKTHDFILGFRVWGNADVGCPRKGEFCGAFLPDELPSLYPNDCPNLNPCNCINHEFVMRGDMTLEADELKERAAQRVVSQLRPVDVTQPIPAPFEHRPIGVVAEEPALQTFTYAEVRVLRKLLAMTGLFEWDPKGYWSHEIGYPSDLLQERLVLLAWIRCPTPIEALMKLTTVPKLKEMCAAASLPRSGDKKMLVERVVRDAPQTVATHLEGANLFVVTDMGNSAIGQQSGHAHREELINDMAQREQSVQKLVRYARQLVNAKVQVNANSWSTCPKLPQIVGVYRPDDVPYLPPGDCPNLGSKPCSCWNVSIIGPINEPAPAVIMEPEEVQTKQNWFGKLLKFLGF